ncbi:pilus assembly FimT family protein [Leptospira sp. GIMC2001]|uniref:pilus assembly FimT family protein n=1 Tax=Leptospira sp. GIMC2001 TaxID=1513297 RepID=UPI002349815B|nr:type II secretion system protein [Leptospira sp. GIMC2001]WCL47938.1 type II secretion system protein [Leptospira sp. GIMC2001]
MLQTKRLKLRHGMTTIELIVVIALIGFLFTVTAVSLKNFIIPSSKDVSQAIEGSIKFAYNHALLNHKTVIFEIDLDNQVYKLIRIERDDEGLREEQVTKPKKLPFNNKIISIVDFSGKITTSGIIRIPYSHDGTGVDYTLLMGEENTIKKSIQVYRYGGKVNTLNGEKLRIVNPNLQKVDYGVDDRDDSDSRDMNRY